MNKLDEVYWYGSSARAEREVVEVQCTVHRSAPNFDDLSLFEYHSYIKMDTPIGISGKSGI